MIGNQYELAEPKIVGKIMKGGYLYKKFQPYNNLSPKMMKHWKEYQVYYRSGRCWACGSIVGQYYLEVGHLIERCIGGSKSWDNIRPMCITCNRVLKPVHETIKEVMEWRKRVWDEQRRNEQAMNEIDKKGGWDYVLKHVQEIGRYFELT